MRAAVLRGGALVADPLPEPVPGPGPVRPRRSAGGIRASTLPPTGPAVPFAVAAAAPAFTALARPGAPPSALLEPGREAPPR